MGKKFKLFVTLRQTLDKFVSFNMQIVSFIQYNVAIISKHSMKKRNYFKAWKKIGEKKWQSSHCGEMPDDRVTENWDKMQRDGENERSTKRLILHFSQSKIFQLLSFSLYFCKYNKYLSLRAFCEHKFFDYK